MRALVASLLLIALPAVANADTFKLFAEIHGGGMAGKGTAGADKSSAFFEKSPHLAYGAEIGAELLFFDAWIEHHQYTDGKRITTWTQFGLGVHNEIELGDAKQRKAHKGGYFEFGGGLWFGLGTGQQVKPPLDNAQITDKAFLLEGRLGFGTHLNKVFDLGFELPISYGYFFKSGPGAAANNMSDQYRGFQGEALVMLRANLRLL